MWWGVSLLSHCSLSTDLFTDRACVVGGYRMPKKQT